MNARRGDSPLRVDREVVKEIAREVARMFAMQTDRLTVRADEYAIQVMIYPGEDGPFLLPDGPVEIRYWEEKMELFLERRN